MHIPRPSLRHLTSTSTIHPLSPRGRSTTTVQRNDTTYTSGKTVVGEELLAAAAQPESEAPPAVDLKNDTRMLGTYSGVFARVLQTLLGLIMLIRLPWIVGQCGVIGTLLIIGITMSITAVTALSISAICSNGRLPAGGVYLILSRSLGAEVGVSTAVLFAIANGLSVSLHAVGWAETISTLLRVEWEYDMFADAINEVRLFASVLGFAVLLVCFFGFKWIIRSKF